eukprot:NODE_668_length_2485_cov_42.581287_g573_i0.p1 GENE.NODE_668_length_2485_cov_42.581287_g573_i0~~NODE_668_length_2485_cov_42.581287_g573_i0.p1  ORF type:complete len:499 (+),score=96.80 NODE_668_length_2485_cov_42.581287_g573_i0:112-1497(+)
MLCKSIIQRMGGSIFMDESGTPHRILVVLPLRTVNPKKLRKISFQAIARPMALVITDNPHLHTSLSYYMNGLGIDTTLVKYSDRRTQRNTKQVMDNIPSGVIVDLQSGSDITGLGLEAIRWVVLLHPVQNGIQEPNTSLYLPLSEGQTMIHLNQPLTSQKMAILNSRLSGMEQMIPRALSTNSSVNSLAGMSFLVVDDDDINRKILSRHLATIPDAKINFATNGQEAVDSVLSPGALFDIIFMDISMPIMDGITATRHIRSWETTNPNTKRTPIIAVTANAGVDKQTCFEAGVDAYLTKPITRQVIIAFVHKYRIFTGDLQSSTRSRVPATASSQTKSVNVFDNTIQFTTVEDVDDIEILYQDEETPRQPDLSCVAVFSEVPGLIPTTPSLSWLPNTSSFSLTARSSMIGSPLTGRPQTMYTNPNTARCPSTVFSPRTARSLPTARIGPGPRNNSSLSEYY